MIFHFGAILKSIIKQKEANITSYNTIGEHLHHVVQGKMFIDYIKQIAKKGRPWAYIASRQKFISISKNNIHQDLFYLPPQTPETSFSLDFINIGYNKNFKHKKEFDIM